MSSTDDGSAFANCINLRHCPNAKAGVDLAWYRGAGEFCPVCGEALALIRTAVPVGAAPALATSDRHGAAPSSEPPPPTSTGTRHLALRSHRKVRVVSAARVLRARRGDAADSPPPPQPPPAQQQVTSVVAPRPAPLQPVPAWRRRWWPAAMPIALLCAALVSLASLIALRPRIVGVAVPSIAQPESLVTITYRATGFGSADYTVLGPDGQTVLHAPLGLGTGTIGLTLPRASATRTYLLRLRAGNELASTTADYYIAVPAAVARTVRRLRVAGSVPRPVIGLPQIRSLALDRARLASGDALGVYYDVDAADGTIELRNPGADITYAKAALAPSGHTAFTMPHVDGPQLLTVVLTARRGTQTTQSRIGVSVLPGDASALPGAPSDAVAASTAAGQTPGTLSAPYSVRSLQPIRVEVRGAAADAQVVMLDPSGNEFARREVRAGGQSVDFTAPAVRTTTRYTFEATFPSGNGSETVVREIAVTP